MACKYAKYCGGCSLQHLSYENQLKEKQKYMESLLSRFHRVNKIIGCRNNEHYRNKMQVSFGKDERGKRMRKLERQFQRELIKELKARFKGCLVLKNDAGYIQGIPDLLILYKNKWAALECKMHGSASKRPNQEYYVESMNKMSCARFICPENNEEILDELSKTFRPSR